MGRQRMFHGKINAAALADQLAAQFNERHKRTSITHNGVSSLVQIGSKHGTPATVHITDTDGGVLVTMSRDRDWLDRASDAGDLLTQAASGNKLSLLALLPEVFGELQKENITPQIWDVINDICSLTLTLAGEKNAPKNPKVCEFCGTANLDEEEHCFACGGVLPVVLPRVCPKCESKYTSTALFCQACGTRLITG
ncbi:MAG: hypothetical protein CL609_07700 [Anaerolineaceae bacterium]|nr:hypothetical protein [Anaerolineaceae bacterium]